MKWYAVAEIDVTDPSWVRDYVADVTKIVERRGGRYLAQTTQVRRQFRCDLHELIGRLRDQLRQSKVIELR